MIPPHPPFSPAPPISGQAELLLSTNRHATPTRSPSLFHSRRLHLPLRRRRTCRVLLHHRQLQLLFFSPLSSFYSGTHRHTIIGSYMDTVIPLWKVDCMSSGQG
ncbi:hypothetical protein PYCCODRAFT_133726 [Trametes coccinea BRFM310]|uniref:Uncharacterized protein n=1 Tax=Trametes coccinea (strain BRFM310) TaxID=1353009 RepID=A0A1Y2ISX5_TRAC3|nr:hypothetical protein PYCCODRAFT_133726 [Trametes coccinea BRFM310]